MMIRRRVGGWWEGSTSALSFLVSLNSQCTYLQVTSHNNLSLMVLPNARCTFLAHNLQCDVIVSFN
uniref:Secreted protein n=1 Tax=Zea mays TaxID=4577 RepID=C0PNX7_MAIZE|nr:unknown [Zea mays]